MRVLLQGEGYSVALATNRWECVKLATGHIFDLIVLDIMPPDGDGPVVYRDIRKAGIATPILALMAPTQTTSKAPAFRPGTDDYITRPFDNGELLARIKARLNRVRGPSFEHYDRARIIKVDVRHTQVTRNGNPVSMTAHEFRLLHYLVKRPGRCVSRGELLKTVWGYASNSTTRTVDVHIASLRKKLEADPKCPELIRTIPKVGYMFMKFGEIHYQRSRQPFLQSRRHI